MPIIPKNKSIMPEKNEVVIIIPAVPGTDKSENFKYKA